MHKTFPETLSSRLHLNLPGVSAQRSMEPELSFGRHAGPPRVDARQAAVVALLYPHQDAWHIPLMLRPATLAHHASQISLPGGTIEPGELTEEAALRELEEELGIARLGVLLLGQLTPLYLYGTNFWVTPWVAAVRWPVQFVPSADEVAEVLEVPLAHFLSPTSRGEQIHERGGVRFRAPHYTWGNHRIWGATSMILAELAAVAQSAAHSTTF